MLAVGAVLVEQWVGRWSWPVDESWYRVTEVDGVVTVGCQNFAPVQFSAEPAPGVTRVLVAGGSTTFGFPARPTGSEPIARARHGFVGAMQAALDEAFPGRVELVNLGINGGASDDTVRVLGRVLRYGADAVVLYDGHNEFMSVPGRFTPALWGLATYRRVAVLFPRVVESPGWVGPPAYGSPAQAEAVVRHFRDNIARVVALARAADVPLLVATQPSNLAGFQPSWSTVGDVEGAADLAPAARRARLDRHPSSADLAYLVAHDPLEQGQEADALLRVARDHDAMPFRASSAVNDAIREVATREGLPLVDLDRALSTHGSPGLEAFYDWVHPTPAAAATIADLLLDGMARAGMLPGPAAPAPVFEPPRDEALGLHAREAVAWLQWGLVRHHDDAERLGRARGHAEAALALSPGDPAARVLLDTVVALERGERPPPVHDPALRTRLESVHPRMAGLLGDDR